MALACALEYLKVMACRRSCNFQVDQKRRRKDLRPRTQPADDARSTASRTTCQVAFSWARNNREAGAWARRRWASTQGTRNCDFTVVRVAYEVDRGRRRERDDGRVPREAYKEFCEILVGEERVRDGAEPALDPRE
jgi:hypothetical protein